MIEERYPACRSSDVKEQPQPGSKAESGKQPREPIGNLAANVAQEAERNAGQREGKRKISEQSSVQKVTTFSRKNRGCDFSECFFLDVKEEEGVRPEERETRDESKLR